MSPLACDGVIETTSRTHAVPRDARCGLAVLAPEAHRTTRQLAFTGAQNRRSVRLLKYGQTP